MKLIGSLTSPYTRKVRVVLFEKNLPADFVVDIPWSPQTTVPSFNPLGKVPVLVNDDGSTLFDSRVIAEYLDGLAPGTLLGETFEERIAIKRWEALADGVSDAAAAIVIENRRVEAERSAAWIERQRGKLEAGIDALAAGLNGRGWCVGEAFSLADIATGCALGFVAFRLPQVEWASRHPALSAFMARINQRAGFAETAPRE